MSRNRTILNIAHRLSPTMRAGGIMVMDRSRIVERGSHEGPVRRDGLYAHWRLPQRRDAATLQCQTGEV